MRPWTQRFEILILLGFAAVIPATAAAQAPPYLGQWGTRGAGSGQFERVDGVAVDAAGNVYTTDRAYNRVQKFTSSGGYLTAWGSQGTGNGQFDTPIASRWTTAATCTSPT